MWNWAAEGVDQRVVDWVEEAVDAKEEDLEREGYMSII